MIRDVQDFRLAVLALACSITVGLAIWGALRLFERRRGRVLTRADRGIIGVGFSGTLILVACFGWAALVEPDWISETHLELHTSKLPHGQLLRIVHLSDLHVDKPRSVFSDLPERVNALNPDLIVFTGDSLNSAKGLPLFRELVSAMHARLGRYAVRGNHDVNYWANLDLFGGGVATELTGAPVAVPETNLTLCGAAFASGTKIRECLHETPEERMRVAVYHTPDLIEWLAPDKPDLYLAGHTHGGQVRAPLYGALITMSRFDKRYEMGEYRVEDTTLFVSRGVGVEPGPLRIRFLCRPEIAVIDLVGD